ncbi:MAG: hypothetical protein FWF80_09085 [Defluviitaleaceae bacterium]|nr:hypothetical protein [Defluviitaleaceae bacterium]
MSNLYTKRELTFYSSEELQKIAEEQNIVAARMLRNSAGDKEKLIDLIFQYCAKPSQKIIKKVDNDLIKFLNENKKMFNFKEYQTDLKIPATINVYKNCFTGTEAGLKAEGTLNGTKLKQSNAFLLKRGNKNAEGTFDYDIISIVNICEENKELYLVFNKTSLSFVNYRESDSKKYLIGFFGIDESDELYKLSYNKSIHNELKKDCFVEAIPQFEIKNLAKTKSPLAVYFGAKKTYAMGYKNEKPQEIKFDGFNYVPSVVSVKNIEKSLLSDVEFVFGHKAVKHAQNVIYGEKSIPSFFFDMKSLTIDSNKLIENSLKISDMEDNRETIDRAIIIKEFILYLVETAKIQDKINYKDVCVLCPTLEIRYFQSAFSEIFKDCQDCSVHVFPYESAALFKDTDDEYSEDAIVLNFAYDSISVCHTELFSSGIGTNENIDYATFENTSVKDSEEDVVRNNFSPYGYKNLNGWLFKYVKILLSRYYKNPINFNESFFLLYNSGEEGIAAFNEAIETEYKNSENIIPTDTKKDDLNDSDYKKVRRNFYSIKELTENITNEFFSQIIKNDDTDLAEFTSDLHELIDQGKYEELKTRLNSIPQENKNSSSDELDMKKICENVSSNSFSWKIYVRDKKNAPLVGHDNLPQIEISKQGVLRIFKYATQKNLNQMNFNFSGAEKICIIQEDTDFGFIDQVLCNQERDLSPDAIHHMSVSAVLNSAVMLHEKLYRRDFFKINNSSEFERRTSIYLKSLGYELKHDGANTCILDKIIKNGHYAFNRPETVKHYAIKLSKKDGSSKNMGEQFKPDDFDHYDGNQAQEFLEKMGKKISDNMPVNTLLNMALNAYTIFICETPEGLIKEFVLKYSDDNRGNYSISKDCRILNSHFDFYEGEFLV